MNVLSYALILVTAVQTGGQQATRVTVDPGTLEMAVDSTARLEVRAYDDAGRLLERPPTIWVSSDETVVTVDTAGRVTALGPGVARITAMVNRTPGFATVTVRRPPPASIAFDLPQGSIPAGTSVPLDVSVRDAAGATLEGAEIEFESDDPSVATVDATGRVLALEPGRTTIRARSGQARARLGVQVGPNPFVDYEIRPASLEVRTGDVVRLRVHARRRDGSTFDGLKPAWTVGGPDAQVDAEGSEGVFVAEEPGTYRVTAAIGPGLSRSTVLEVVPRRVDTELIRVGRGPITTHNSGDMWVFEGVDGRDYAYVGTYQHDWMKAFDVTDPSTPVLTDSVQVDARRINDVKIHPNARLGIITREGASDRKNGIVLLDLSTPAHPTILSEYTETLTGGVHNVWIRGDLDLVYAVHNGTSDIHIIDISDPANPAEVGRWGLDKENKTLHDVIVQDGYAYVSYWDDGLFILDVGAGTHGGTPTEPAVVSQFKYPIGNTHVAWRHGRYVFVGDEIFPTGWNPYQSFEPRGYIHVIDVSDMDRPTEVARYEVPEAGAHNVWADDDKLYVGYYQGGLRVVDISGELRGDLYEQGREIAVLKTAAPDAVVPNWPMTWGAQIYKGHIFSSDFNSGLWITRLAEPPRPLP